MSATPVLWHIPVSHYSEKARWALAYKGVEHERRAPPPGIHIPVAMALTRSMQPTFPVLQLDRRGPAIGDSTAIIAALEERYPDAPLYPDDPQLRDRALELEDYFDETLGPQIRLLAWHDIISDEDGPGIEPVSTDVLPERLRGVKPLTAVLNAYGTAYVRVRFRVSSDERAAHARDNVIAAFERLESELDGNSYLAGDDFSVADLTAAALFYPIVQPPEGPQILTEQPPTFARFADQFRDRPAFAYLERMFRKHR